MVIVHKKFKNANVIQKQNIKLTNTKFKFILRKWMLKAGNKGLVIKL